MKITVLFGIVLGLFFGCTTKKSNEISADSKIEAWARPGAQGQMSGAYFVYENQQPVADTLISVKSPVAKMTQIHESYTTEDGLAGMREMTQIIVQADEKLILQQGGLHVMLMGLNKDLVVADSVQVSLLFSQAGEVIYKLPVLVSN